MAAILKKSTWRHYSAADPQISTKYDRQMQNGMPMTIHRSKSKPEIGFQYGGRPLSETGSSFIPAVNWDILLKFGTQIYFHLAKQMSLLNRHPKMNFRLYGCHLKKLTWRHNFAADRPIATKFGRQMQNGVPMITDASNQNRK